MRKPQDSDVVPDGSAGASDREQLIAVAVADYLDLESRGDLVDKDEFFRLHEHLQPELRDQIEALDHIETVLLPAADRGEQQPSNDSERDLPERLSGHKIIDEIGAGGMGRVLLGFDEGLGRRVAIKTLRPRYANNPVLKARFMHEARAMARLSHRNVARIYNLGPEDEPAHFVMEYLEGASLTRAAERLPLRAKVELMHRVVEAVDFLHKHQIIHRDLKPANILVGTDLEPKVLDFGIALQTDERGTRFTLAGEVIGTPDYFSPEQASADAPLDARSDIFSLGAILYELLTGAVPFRAETIHAQIERLRERDATLPRRINPSIPGEIQNICMKALEKKPEDRYGSAREMADDLARFLAGEPVLALPLSYSRIMSGKIEQHVRELNGWKQDQILSEYEFDAFRKLYDGLVEREDAWIMEVRRLSLPQVSLYLGAWLLVIGGALMALFQYLGLPAPASVMIVCAAAVPTGYFGIRSWKLGRFRIAVAYLLAFCLLLPIALIVAMHTLGAFGGFTQDREDLELFSKMPWFKKTTNAQLWWSLLISLPTYFFLRRFTRAAVFSLVFSVMAAVFSLVTLLRMGLIDWLEKDPGKVYFYLIPIAALFFAVGLLIERLGYAADAGYFFPIAVGFTLIGLSGVAAFHEPYAEWLKSVAPVTRGQVEYLFMINAGIYLVLQFLGERLATPQMRSVAKAFRFVIPGHIMMSLLVLGISATNRWQASPDDSSLRFEAHVFEVMLPIVACVFVFGSISKQMKNFLASGLLFLAIGIVRLQRELFEDRSVWPIGLLSAGFLVMLLAANYSAVKRRVADLFERKR